MDTEEWSELPSTSVVEKNLKKSLISRYKYKHVLKEVDSWPPFPTNLCINLALIHRLDNDKVNEFAHYTIQGTMDDILKKKSSITYQEAFSKYQSGVFILIEGRPGSGKTTLVNKISRDWANGEPVLKEANLVFLISLKVLSASGDKKMLDLLKLLHQEEEACTALQSIEKSSGEGVCFIFDGLDEYVGSDKSVVSKILFRQYLPNSMLIVASRPVATAKLRNIADTRIEILGFLKTQVHECVSQYPFTKRNAESLIAYLSKYPNVLHMCYLPIHTMMISFLYDKIGELPHTETEIYSEFTTLTLQHCNITLNEDSKRVFEKICKIAFDMIISSQQVFSCDDIAQFCLPENSKPFFDLVTLDVTVEYNGYGNLFTFSHLTFQEYLAAYHISTLDEEEQLKVISQCREKKHMQVVWKFYCGSPRLSFSKGPLKISENNFKQILKLFHDDKLFHCQCAFESQQPNTCKSVLEKDTSGLSFKNHIFHASDIVSISYVIEHTSDYFLKLSLCGCNIRDNLSALMAALKKCKNLQCLDLANNDIDDSGAVVLEDCLDNFSELQKLNLSHNRIGNDGIKAIVCGLQDCKKLKTLELIGTSAAPFSFHFLKRNVESLQQCMNYKRDDIDLFLDRMDLDTSEALAKSLNSFVNLQTLKLRWNGMGDKGITAMVSNLSACNSLCSLDLFGSKISDKGLKSINDLLKHCNKLKILDLGLNNIYDEGAQSIFDCLKKNCPLLQSLSLPFNKITSNGIANCSYNFRFIHVLDLKWNQIGSGGAKAVASSLQCAETLQILNLNKNVIGPEGAAAIANNLKNWKTLRELHLYGNCIEVEGAMVVAENLQFCCNLEDLDLGLNSIQDEGAIYVSKSLYHCSMLKKLGLSSNKISEKGAVALVKKFDQCKFLQTIDVSKNSLSAVEFSRRLSSPNRLEELNLSHNLIDDEGAKALAKSLNNCICLQILKLNNNNIHDDGAQALAENLKHCEKLKVFDMYDNKLKLKGTKALARHTDLDSIDFSHSNVDIAQMSDFKGLECCERICLEHNNIGDNGAQILAERMKGCDNLETIYLYHNQIGDDGGKFLGEAIKSCTNLKMLYIHNNRIGDDGAKGLAGGLKYCKSIKALNLHDNHISSVGAKYLAEALKECSKFEALDISHNQIGSEGAKYIAKGLEDCSNFLALIMGRNKIGSDGVEHLFRYLQACKKFYQLHIIHNQIGDAGAKSLADGLKGYSYSNFQDLVLEDNEIGDDGAKALGKAMKHYTRLSLEHNWIGDSGAEGLAEGMKRSNNLEMLCLDGNKIGDVGARYLAEGLKHSINVKELGLAHNHIGNDGASDLGLSLQYGKIEYLYLQFNKIQSAYKLAEGLKYCTKLVTLNLSHNQIGDEGARDLAEGLQNCTCLKSLSLQHNEITDYGLSCLLKSLIHCQVLTYLHLGYNLISDSGLETSPDALCHYKSLQKLSLDGNSIGDAGTVNLSQAIKDLKTLIELNLSFNRIGNEGVRSLADSIYSCSLNTLNLDHNQISDKGIQALVDALTFHHYNALEKLSLDFSTFQSSTAETLSKFFLQNCKNLKSLSLKSTMLSSEEVLCLSTGLSKCSHLTNLNLEHNHIGLDAMSGLDTVPKSLETLHLGYNGIGGAGITTLADGLRHCTGLVALYLDHNKITDGCVEFLVNGLKHCFSLRLLSFEYNRIGDVGAAVLAECLKSCYNLEDLNLQANMIGDKGATALVQCLQLHTHFNTLNFKSNKIGNDGAKILCEELKLCKNLETLHLESNNISKENITAFQDLKSYLPHLKTLYLDSSDFKVVEELRDKNEQVLTFKYFNFCYSGAKTLANGLINCKNLQILYLGSNDMEDIGVVGLASGLEHCSNLHTLHLDINLIGDEGAQSLALSLKHCTKIKELNLAQNKIGDSGVKALHECLKNFRNFQELNLERNMISSACLTFLKKEFGYLFELRLDEQN